MTFMERYYRSGDGLRLYYRDYDGGGDKPVVLCLPGLTRNSADFENLASHLATGFRVLCPDLRGRGKSDYAPDPVTYQPAIYVADMQQLLADAGVDQCIVIGTSLGGLMAMIMGAGMKEKLLGVIMNDIGPELDPKGVDRIRSYVGLATVFDSWDAAVANVQAGGKIAFPHFNDVQWMDFCRRVCVEKDGVIQFNYDLRIAEPFKESDGQPGADLWPMYDGLGDIPLLCIRGELSDLLSVATFTQMQVRNPEMHAVTVPGVGHAPTLDEVEARRAIDIFMAQF